ncbi:Uncharacterized protein TCM_013906 [Theobroma cacao]|uniref:Uncharacterized protein n=1 Tax=Theobroma cacao TaxID=3641 RepID=A0A061FW97_THECC|nr:Uncharacterized protein TCM_013906 [Theobroma cacao]
MVCLPMVSSHGKPHTSSCTLGNQPIYFGCRQSPISSARALQAELCILGWRAFGVFLKLILATKIIGLLGPSLRSEWFLLAW